jgi:hypothetical protein
MSDRQRETEMHFDEADIAIRMLTTDDDPALYRLAGLDSAEIPGGHLLGASVGGRLVAAQSLASGKSIADPFLPTGQIRMLLAQRAGQLNGRGRGRLLGRLRRRRSRGALPSSPPGAGGKLLQI